MSSSTIFIRVYGVDPDIKDGCFDGSQFVGGKEMKGHGSWIGVSSFGFSAARNVTMMPGEAKGQRDTGMQGFSAVGVTKETCTMSEVYQSLLLAPNIKKAQNAKEGDYNLGGDRVDLVVTESTGENLRVIYSVKLESTHVISYNLGGSTGSIPFESIQLAYARITVIYYYWNAQTGQYVAGGEVSFDLPKNQAMSYWKDVKK
ncbi:hypothetical protein [Candidatus Sororendozoicomonas aggregata]|uniref:hypothetical protein n=1 Tax=Candidatus Sororendozoicomonas aggregata TaxID=3073239 RepID=UPI002ED1865C